MAFLVTCTSKHNTFQGVPYAKTPGETFIKAKALPGVKAVIIQADLAGRVQDLRDGGDAGDIQLLLTKVAKAKRKLGELRLELPTEFRDDLKNLSIKLNAIESDLRKRHRDSASTETPEVLPTKPEVDAGS